MGNAIITTAQLGMHACIIEMLEQAEAGKERTLKLKLSDNIKKGTIHEQGKLKRMWFLTQMLNNINFSANASEIKVSIEESTEIIAIEIAHIETTDIMLKKFVKLITILNLLIDLDIYLNELIVSSEHTKWNFSILNQKTLDISSFKNKEDFSILAFLFGYHSYMGKDFYLTYGDEFNNDCFQQGKELYDNTQQYLDISKQKSFIEQVPVYNKDRLLYGLLINNITEVIALAKIKFSDYFVKKESAITLVSKNGDLLERLDINLRNDKDVVLAAVCESGTALEYASDELKNDKDVVLVAVNQSGDALKYASNELKNNKEIVLAAIKQSGLALKYANDELKHDKNVVLAAVNWSGYALQYASDELKNDKDVVLAAVNRSGYALKYASYELKNDKDLVLAAIKNNESAIQFAGPIAETDEDILLEKIKHNIFAINTIIQNLPNPKEFIIKSIQADSDVYLAIDQSFKQDKNILKVYKEANKK